LAHLQAKRVAAPMATAHRKGAALPDSHLATAIVVLRKVIAPAKANRAEMATVPVTVSANQKETVRATANAVPTPIGLAREMLVPINDRKDAHLVAMETSLAIRTSSVRLPPSGCDFFEAVPRPQNLELLFAFEDRASQKS
jgi:spore maturation protein SpmA